MSGITMALQLALDTIKSARTTIERLDKHNKELKEALEVLRAFVGIMHGIGPDAVIPDNVTTPLGTIVYLGGIIRQVDTTLAKEG